MPTDELEDEVCEFCGGTGFVTVDEPVYPDAGSPTAPIGERPCICQAKTDDDEYDDQD